MSFFDTVSAVDATILATFTEKQVTIHDPQGLALDVTVDCIVKNPVFEEDYVPGSSPGPTNLWLFIRIDNPLFTQYVPAMGGGATYGGVDYNISRVDVDREGGATLVLLKRSQPWGQ